MNSASLPYRAYTRTSLVAYVRDDVIIIRAAGLMRREKNKTMQPNCGDGPFILVLY